VSEPVLVSGGRDVRATLDSAASDGSRSDAVVVACPPHPQHGGHRGDERLTALSDALADRGVDCLRIDYGAWDEGYGESTDADNAVGWARERYDRVGLFGFSFGATVALVAAAARPGLDAVCALAPTARLAPDVDAVAALDDLVALSVPTRVLYATRDSTVDWEPVVERAADRGVETAAFESDHFFVGRAGDAGEAAATFLAARLRADR
jgi:hypothetical protein